MLNSIGCSRCDSSKVNLFTHIFIQFSYLNFLHMDLSPVSEHRKPSPVRESLVLHVEKLSRNVNEGHLKEIFSMFNLFYLLLLSYIYILNAMCYWVLMVAKHLGRELLIDNAYLLISTF